MTDSKPTTLRRLVQAAVCALGVTAIGTASAAIVDGEVLDRSGGGDAFEQGAQFNKLELPFDPPNGPQNTVGDNTFQNPNFYGFDEEQNVIFNSPIEVDLLADTGQSGTLSPADVQGSIVASHYMFFDPGPSTRLLSTAEFDAEILGVVTSTPRLKDTDFLANTGVNYLNPGLRGFESPDSVTLTGPNSLEFKARASTPGDYFRVLTEFSPTSVPTPTGMGLLAAGLMALGLGRFGMDRRREVV